MDRDALMADAIIGLLDDSAVAAELPGGEYYALASMFGEDWGDAMEGTLEAVANIDDRPTPELKACCCNNCLTEFFVSHPTAARNAFTTMTELKAELQTTECTDCAPVPHKGKSRPRMSTLSLSESSEEDGEVTVSAMSPRLKFSFFHRSPAVKLHADR
jgi:hypothetical protein